MIDSCRLGDAGHEEAESLSFAFNVEFGFSSLEGLAWSGH
jgi:hypothetical protein